MQGDGASSNGSLAAQQCWLYFGFTSPPCKPPFRHRGSVWARGLTGHVCRVRPLESNCCKRSLFSSTPAVSRCVHHLFCCCAPEKNMCWKLKTASNCKKMPFRSQPRACSLFVFFCHSSKSLSGHNMLYNAPTFISFYFILFLQQCYVSQQTHRVRKRLLEPGSAPGCFFLLLCLCNIHEQRVGEGLGPPQVTVLTRKSQCL